MNVSDHAQDALIFHILYYFKLYVPWYVDQNIAIYQAKFCHITEGVAVVQYERWIVTRPLSLFLWHYTQPGNVPDRPNFIVCYWKGKGEIILVILFVKKGYDLVSARSQAYHTRPEAEFDMAYEFTISSYPPPPPIPTYLYCWQWENFTMGPNGRNQHYAELRQKACSSIHEKRGLPRTICHKENEKSGCQTRVWQTI